MKKILLSTFALWGLISESPAQQHTVGERCCGGVVFKVDSGGQHGLVAPETDLPGKYKWEDAKNECNGLNLNGFRDWRLPTKEELSLMYQNKKIIGGFANASYWSSTEYNATTAWFMSFTVGYQGIHFTKDFPLRVHAVRSF